MSNTVLAAGAVVWRKRPDESVEIAIIHRPRYDDWSLPKGKLENGEALISCAYREVMEETGLEVRLGPFIASTEYFVMDGLKEVSYWAAESIGIAREFHPNNEVDQLVWLTPTEAVEKVTRDSDREVIEKFVSVPFDASALIMLRHAKALARQEWQGDDDDRPLDLLGQQQAKRFLSLYQVFGLEEIYTSDAVRCMDTIGPMAKSLNLEPVITHQISEYTFKKNKDKAVDFVRELVKKNSVVLLCSHNPVLPKMLGKLTKKIDFELPDAKLLPGESWILYHRKKEVLQVDRLAAPVIGS